MKVIHSISIPVAFIILSSCNFGIPAGSGNDVSTANLFSVPSGENKMELPAITSEDRIITHKGYVISYNTSTLIPNWVAYELTEQEADGDEERGERTFSMDPDFKGFQGRREDYHDSGWSKGHMAPAGDFRWDEDAMDETFYLTNICPQNSNLNGKDWNYLEKRVRGWARDFGRVWVVTGPYVGENRYGRIGDRHVTVPDSFFKAVLVRKGNNWHSIAFMMDNDSSRQYLKDCSMSVNDLEDITGYDFFPMLDDACEESVEDQMSLGYWRISH